MINTYEDDTAVYDDKSYGIDYRLRGALIYPNPRNACSPVEKPSSNPSMFFAFVANYDNCVGRNVGLLDDHIVLDRVIIFKQCTFESLNEKKSLFVYDERKFKHQDLF